MIDSYDPKRIRQFLIYSLANKGRPFMCVVDGKYAKQQIIRDDTPQPPYAMS